MPSWLMEPHTAYASEPAGSRSDQGGMAGVSVSPDLDLQGFRALIGQPLLLQIPLQGVLELLFTTIRSQAAAIGELQGQVAGLSGRAAALQERQQAALLGTKEALRRLELRLKAQEAAAVHSQQEASIRLHDLERQLHGASNLAGRQAALDDIAAMLGVAVSETVTAPLHVHVDARGKLLAHAPHLAAEGTEQHPAAGALLVGSFAKDSSTHISKTPAAATSEEIRPGVPASLVTSSPSTGAAGSVVAGPAAAETSAQPPPKHGSKDASDLESSSTVDEAHEEAWEDGAQHSIGADLFQPAAVGEAACTADHQPTPRRSSTVNSSRSALVPSAPAAAAPAPSPYLGQHSHAGRPAFGSASRGASATGKSSSGRPSSVGSGADSTTDMDAAPTAGDLALQPNTHKQAAPDVDVEGGLAAPQGHEPGSITGSQGLLTSHVAASPKPAPASSQEAPSPTVLLAAMQGAKQEAKQAAMPKATAGGKSTLPYRRTSNAAAASAVAGAAGGAAASAGAGAGASQASQQQQARPRVASIPHPLPCPGAPSSDSSSPTQQPAGGEKQEGQGAERAQQLDTLVGGGSPRVSERGTTDVSRRLSEVANLLRKRPSIQENGLLWQLQASLQEAVEEQERLKGEVRSLQERLQAQQASTGSDLQQCNQRIHAVEVAVAGGSLPFSSHSQAPPFNAAPVEKAVKVLEDRVNAMDGQMQLGADKVGKLEGRLKANEARLAGLEVRQETTDAAARLVRASRTGSGGSTGSGTTGDTLSALQGHLLAQQQKLQAHLDSMAAGIRQGLPGQVHDAVLGAVGEVGRRLSERLATKQELQTLSYKVTGKVSREEVERMLRAYKASAGPAAAEPGSGPAAGIKLKCISCDTDLQPFLFAAAPGALPQSAGVAELRYTQLPAASPARNPQQPWTAAVSAAGTPGATARPNTAAPLSGGGSGSCGQYVQLPAPQSLPSGGINSSRPSTAASRLGAPVSWMHRRRRDTSMSGGVGVGGANQDGATPPVASRRESAAHADARLGRQPSVTSLPLQRPQTAAPMAANGGSPGGGGVYPHLNARLSQSQQQQREQKPDFQRAAGAEAGAEPEARGASETEAGEFYEAIREEGEPSVAAPAGGSQAGTPRPAAKVAPETTIATSTTGINSGSHIGHVQGGTSKVALPALQLPSSPRHNDTIKAVRPATAAVLPPSGAAADWEQGHENAVSIKRKTVGAASGL